MNIKIFLSLLLLILLPLSLSVSCARYDATQVSSTSNLSSVDSSLLAAWQSYVLADAAQQSRIEALESEMAQLYAGVNGTQSDTDTSRVPAQFLYEEQDGSAIITGFSGNVSSLVIPAAINGIPVIAVASGAFRDSSLESVIISNGVQKIDWFAFYGSHKLSTVTIPNSVLSIGHAAFDGCASSLSVHCAEGSFAMAYCKSYGIAYTVI